jgi:hypothetical protein
LLQQLLGVGVRDTSTAVLRAGYGNLPVVGPGWAATSAYFKGERGLVNIGLGNGRALDIFNSNISGFQVIPK